MKLAICNETYRGWAFTDVCADVAACGYDGIELALSEISADPRELTARDARALKAIADRAKLEVVGLHWLLAVPGGMHLTTPDRAVRSATVRYLQHLAELCAALGGRIMVLGSPQQRSIVADDDREAAFERAVAGCRTVATTCHELGVTLAIEPLAPAITNFVTTADEAVRLIRTIDHPGCRLHLDVLAMSTESRAIPEIIRANGADLAHFHANDDNRGGPGSGGVDYAPIAAALRDVGYSGFVSVEVFDMTAGGPTIARDSIAFLRELFASP